MVAQGCALIVAPEQAAALQFRHDAIDELREGAGEMRRQDVEPIGRALDEPFFQGVGDAGLVGLITLGIILWLFSGRKTA